MNKSIDYLNSFIDFSSYFDHVCDKTHPNPSTQALLDVQKFAGLDSATTDWILWDEFIHPLDWFAQEVELNSGDAYFSLASDTSKARAAFDEATDLKHKFQKVTSGPLSPFQACVYVHFTPNEDESGINVPIVFDTGASISITPFKNDFVEPLEPPDVTEINGINSSAAIKGIGWVEWTIRDQFGCVCLL